MKIRPSLNLLLTGILAAMLLTAVACGSGDNEPQTSSIESTAATTTVTEMPTATATTTDAPLTTTAPVTTTTAPVTTTTDAPLTTTAPVTTTTAPVTTTTAPVTTTTAPVTTTTVPVTTTTVPETTKVPEPTKQPELAAPIDLSALEDELDAYSKKYGAVGVQAAVIADGQLSTYEYGWAEKNERKMEADTKIRIASLSKTVVGMVTFRLIEEGKLDLDADISDYVGVEVRNPYYPDTAITLRMLLSHTSSLQNASYVNSTAKLQSKLKASSTYTKNKPGKVYEYNNFGLGVVGAICEIVTDQTLDSLVKQYFFDPMLIDATFAPASMDASKQAVIYRADDSVGLSVSASQKSGIATAPVEHMTRYAGGLIISAADYAKLLTLLANDGVYDGVRYLTAESVAAMESVQIARSKKADQCLPVWYYEDMYDGRDLFYHTGSAYGVYALYTYDPAAKIATVVVTTGASLNYDACGVYAICGNITQEIYKNAEVAAPAEPSHAYGGTVYEGDGRIVAIDAGHQAKAMTEKEPLGPGSEELKAKLSSGTQGVSTGIAEYQLNLTVALALRDELIARGYTVVMIRESNEVTLSNAERAEIANAAGAGAFVRIHANGSENRSKQGAYTICQTPDNPYNGDLHDESYRLSEALIGGYVAETGMKQLKIWETDTMTGINWAKVPSTIIEMGYMSNAEEDGKMASADFPKQAAIGMADGLDAFFAE